MDVRPRPGGPRGRARAGGRGAAPGAARAPAADADRRRAAVLRGPLRAADRRADGLLGEHRQHPHRARPGPSPRRRWPTARRWPRSGRSGGDGGDRAPRPAARSGSSAPRRRSGTATSSSGPSRPACGRAAGGGGPLAAVAAALGAVLVAVPLSRAGPRSPARPAPTTGVSTEIYSDSDPRRPQRRTRPWSTAVRRLPWTARAGDRPGVRRAAGGRPAHVVFVGDYAGTRWALVAAADSTEPPPPDGTGTGLPDLDRLESLMVAWFAGPSGGAPEDMTLQTVPRFVDARRADRPVVSSATGSSPSWPRRATRSTCRPGGPSKPTATSSVRPSSRLTDDDGIAVLDGGHIEASTDRVLRYRVLRDGAEVTGQFDAASRLSTSSSADVDLARLRPAPPPAPGDAAVPRGDRRPPTPAWAGGPAVADWTVLWAGDLPRIRRRKRRG